MKLFPDKVVPSQSRREPFIEHIVGTWLFSHLNEIDFLTVAHVYTDCHDSNEKLLINKKESV